MTRDVEALTQIIKWCLYAAAFFTTIFPVLYSFSPWWKSHLGRSLMAAMISFALALNFTVVFQFWQPENILWYFWIGAVCYSLIAFSTFGLTVMMIRKNYKRWRKRK